MIKYRKLKNLLIWKCKQKKVGSQLPTATRMAELEEVEPPVPIVLLPCASCSRTFRPEALAKHTKVCEKTLMKKRKKFDSSRQRLQGTDVPVFPPPPKPVKESPLKPIPQTKWREKQAELAKTLHSVRKKSEGGSTIPVKPSDHEQCPYCDRFFGPKAYDRHAEWCKEQHTKLKNSSNINNEARERLQVRTKYRAPLSNKVLTRDKYLPRSRDPSPMSMSRIEVEEPSKTKLHSPALNRSSSLRMSGRSRSMVSKAPSIPPVELRDSRVRNHQSSINVRGREPPHSREPERASLTNGTVNAKPKIVNVNQHPKKDVSKYDPFASAEQQMLELFGGAQSPPEKLTHAQQASPPAQDTQEQKPVSSPDTPSSAFAIYTPLNKRPSSTESLKSDNKENNNLDSDDTMSPTNDRMDTNKNFSLSNLSLCSIISIDSVDCNRNPIGMKSFRVRDEPLQRSCSAVEGKHGRNRVKVNMQQMLYGFDSPDPPLSPTRSVDVGNLEACEAELIVSMMEFEKMLNNSPIPTLDHPSPVSPSSKTLDNGGSPKAAEDDQDSKAVVPLSIDSAYGSLTRASSGEGDAPRAEPSKFCHECGSKYPVQMAKFCCNCGIRRIAI
uniref:Protein FAM164A n=1 Tax=Lygus hesperus TaxID=30085 RepID=A0A0A9WBF7_LYGHE